MVGRTCVEILKEGAAFSQWDSSEGNQARWVEIEDGLFTQQEGGLGIKEWTCQSVDGSPREWWTPRVYPSKLPLPPHKSNNFLQEALPRCAKESFPWPPLPTRHPRALSSFRGRLLQGRGPVCSAHPLSVPSPPHPPLGLQLLRGGASSSAESQALCILISAPDPQTHAVLLLLLQGRAQTAFPVLHRAAALSNSPRTALRPLLPSL